MLFPAYAVFLHSSLIIDLLFFYRKEIANRDAVCEKIAIYSQLKQTLDCIDKVDTSDGLRTQINLGSNFYAQAHM